MLPGVQGEILSSLSDGQWHSARDIARIAGLSPSTASKYLKEYLSLGLVHWKALRPRWPLYKLAHSSLESRVRSHSDRPLPDLLRERLNSAAGGRYYFRGVFAKHVYGLLDWYASISLFEVEVPKSLFSDASEELLDLADYASTLPRSMGWSYVNKALKQGPVVLLGNDYDPKKASAQRGLRVIKLEYLLAEEFERDHPGFRELLERAKALGVDEEKLRKLLPVPATES